MFLRRVDIRQRGLYYCSILWNELDDLTGPFVQLGPKTVIPVEPGSSVFLCILRRI